MANVPWNRQGTQTVAMSSVRDSFQGLGSALSQYWNGRSSFFNPDNGGNNYTQGTRGMSSWLNKSWIYVYGQGGTFGSPNGYTNIYIGQSASYQAYNLQTNYNARVFFRNFNYANGYGGKGGRNLQGYPFNPGAENGQGGVNIQGYSSYVIVNTQGYSLLGGGGGGGAGNQGQNFPTRQPAGGGGGGGGGGFGAAGDRPDAGRQADTAQGGFAQAGGGGAWAGTQGPTPSRSGGGGGPAGNAGGGGGWAGGGAAGPNVQGQWGGAWVY